MKRPGAYERCARRTSLRAEACEPLRRPSSRADAGFNKTTLCPHLIRDATVRTVVLERVRIHDELAKGRPEAVDAGHAAESNRPGLSRQVLGVDPDPVRRGSIVRASGTFSNVGYASRVPRKSHAGGVRHGMGSWGTRPACHLPVGYASRVPSSVGYASRVPFRESRRGVRVPRAIFPWGTRPACHLPVGYASRVPRESHAGGVRHG